MSAQEQGDRTKVSIEPPQLLVSHRAAPGGACHTLVLDGELDYATAPDFVAALDRVPLAAGASMELDLANVPFCDSAGLAALLNAHTRLRRLKGTLRIVAIDPRLLRMLRLTGVAHLFLPGDSVEQS